MNNLQSYSDQRRFDQGQYDFLKRCSEKGEEGIKEWNKKREENAASDICLDGQDFRGWYLRGANFRQGKVFCRDNGKGKEIDYSGEVCLRGADFRDTDATNTCFANAHLEKSMWQHAKAQNADFHHAELQEAYLGVSNLDFCHFNDAILERAKLTASSLRGADFTKTDLRGCQAGFAVVDGSTRLCKCVIDNSTDFTGVGLDNTQIDAATKQLLECNIRRIAWEQWYKDSDEPIRRGKLLFRHQRVRLLTNRMLRWFVRCFWAISDYGISTKRIIAFFVVSALAFAGIYGLSAIACPPGIVNNLLKGDEGPVPLWLVPIRAVYFSIVTMTTLGFGDMHANCQSFWGHLLLTVQVILGYVLLGALVTRFAVLFAAGGPAGRFAESE